MVLDRDVDVILGILAGLRAPQKSHERLDVDDFPRLSHDLRSWSVTVTSERQLSANCHNTALPLSFASSPGGTFVLSD